MRKKKRPIQMTRKGIAYFAVFWLIVYFSVFGFPENLLGKQGETQVEGSLTIHFIDVGQADAAVVLCGGKVLMIDGGNAEDSSLIYSYLRNTIGISHIDYMIATHPHEDHIGGLSGALNACTVGKVYSPVLTYDSKVFSSLVKYTQNQGRQLMMPDAGEVLTLGEALVELMPPVRQHEDINDMSIVVRIVFGDTSFLFTGDAEWEAEHDLIESEYNLSATLLKVGHHGSSSSSSYAFLREVMPKYAVISVGNGNSYGHPSDAVLSRLRDAGAVIYRTDLNGHITVVSDGKNLEVSVQKGGVQELGVGTNQNRPLSFMEVVEEMKRDAEKYLRDKWNEFVSFIEDGIACRQYGHADGTA